MPPAWVTPVWQSYEGAELVAEVGRWGAGEEGSQVHCEQHEFHVFSLLVPDGARSPQQLAASGPLQPGIDDQTLTFVGQTPCIISASEMATSTPQLQGPLASGSGGVSGAMRRSWKV